MTIQFDGTTNVATVGNLVADSVQVGGVAVNLYPLVSGTAVASTSGTSINFTGIPSTAKRITVMLNDVSTSGTSKVLVQVGISTGIVTTGYDGAIGFINSSGAGGTSQLSSGITIETGSLPIMGAVRHGTIIFNKLTGNTWTATGGIGFSNTQACTFVNGAISLAGVLDRVRVTTELGTDNFDLGTINIMWE